MSFIDCEIHLVLTQSANCVLVSTIVAKQNATFAIINTKFDVLFVTLSTQDNVKLSGQLKSNLKEQLTGWNINEKQ